jgi:hypothetical protein
MAYGFNAGARDVHARVMPTACQNKPSTMRHRFGSVSMATIIMPKKDLWIFCVSVPFLGIVFISTVFPIRGLLRVPDMTSVSIYRSAIAG